MIYQNNSLERLSEHESLYTEEDVVKPSRERISIQNGLKRLNLLFEKKYFKLKIEAFYHLISHRTESSLNVPALDLDKIFKIQDNDGQNLAKYGAKTSRRHISLKKSIEFDFDFNDSPNFNKSMHDFDTSDVQTIFKRNNIQSGLDNLNEKGMNLKSIRWSTTSEFGNFEEEDQIILWSSIDESLNDQKSFLVDIDSFIQDEKSVCTTENDHLYPHEDKLNNALIESLNIKKGAETARFVFYINSSIILINHLSNIGKAMI